jgi:hypothetical protein
VAFCFLPGAGHGLAVTTGLHFHCLISNVQVKPAQNSHKQMPYWDITYVFNILDTFQLISLKLCPSLVVIVDMFLNSTCQLFSYVSVNFQSEM